VFKIKTKIKEEVLVRENMYFKYGLTIFKTSKIVDGQLKIGYYDEPSGNLHIIPDPYTVNFLQKTILSGRYIVTEPGAEFTIPEKLRDYVVQY